MRYLLSAVCTLAWALWFGGVIALLLFVVGVLNRTFYPARSDIFAEAATATFLLFERYQLILGAIALVAAFGLRVAAGGGKQTVLFCLLALAAAASITSSRAITPRLVEIWRQQSEAPRNGQTRDVASVLEFQRLHKLSRWVYTVQTMMLLAAGLTLPVAGRAPATRTPARETVA